MNIGWPQGIWLGLCGFSLIAGAVLDGDDKTGKHKFSITLVNAGMMFGLLYWGGFFA